jgi:hypothetical protein
MVGIICGQHHCSFMKMMKKNLIFTGCRVLSKEKKIITGLITYAKGLSCPGAQLLDEDAVDVDDDAPADRQCNL